MTTAADVAACVKAGVELVGFNLWPGSKRFIRPLAAREAWVEGLRLAGVATLPGPAQAASGGNGSARTRAAAVFVDPAPGEVRAAVEAFPELSVLQLHGDEAPGRLLALSGEGVVPPRVLWKALGVGAPADVERARSYMTPSAPTGAPWAGDGRASEWALVLFDVKPTAGEAPGGTGRRFDWSCLAARPEGLVFGVAGGIKPEDVADAAKTGASLIDICSGVEVRPGVKDHALIAKARAALLLTTALAVFAVFAVFAALVTVGAAPARAQEASTPPPPMTSTPPAEDDGSTDLAPLPDAKATPVVPIAPPPPGTEGDPRSPTAPVFRPTQVLSLQELHRWDRHVRGFRREHNFALSAGVSSGTWAVKHFGTIEDRKFDNSGLWTKFQYSFHLPIYRGFGYLLGSSVGYHYESTDRRRPFKPVPAVLFPGVLAGLVLNFNPVFRWAFAADYYLERHDGIEERDGQEDDPEIHVTLKSFDAMSLIDVFYDLNWAVRIETHYRTTQFMRPDKPEKFPVDADIKKTDQWLGVGLVYHLL